MTWEKRYRKERFVNTKKLRGKYDNPLSPEEMKKKIEEHCGGAKDLLMNVNIYRLLLWINLDDKFDDISKTYLIFMNLMH